ncbi:MAG: hypothetical protein K2N82_00490 [Lachnospiraceae bacterium]|nr:hypothetical protein [Lachnospiraceae bacterium]
MKKKRSMILLLSALLLGLTLCGCRDRSVPESPTDSVSVMNTFSPETQGASEILEASEAGNLAGNISESETLFPAEAAQGGPYGKITISLPEGWGFEAYPMDSENLIYGMYGIHFYPEDVKEGYIEVAYIKPFGVCGTGLKSENADIAGQQASIGTYDEHEYWDFISFQGEYEGVVAYTYSVDSWWDKYHEQVWDILNTLSFLPSEREGGAYIYHGESEITALGLDFSLKNISSAGATLVFHQYDPDAPTGELDFGDEFELEVQNDGKWERVPDILEGEYGFNDIAHVIAAGQSLEVELSWEWIYGKLPAGEYRIKKEIFDFRGTGDYDKYTVYAHFILN